MRLVVANNKIRIVVKSEAARDFINKYFDNPYTEPLFATIIYVGIGLIAMQFIAP